MEDIKSTKEKDSVVGYTGYFENMKKVCSEDRTGCDEMIDSLAGDYCCSSSCCCW